jgi:hypothetical protein
MPPGMLSDGRGVAKKRTAVCKPKGHTLIRWYINITITILDIIHRPVF